MIFENRAAAGREIAKRLEKYRGPDVIVLALPRGGVATAAEVASALNAPLDVLITRKIGAPGNPEYGIGAIAENGVYLLNDEEVSVFHAESFVQEEMERQKTEIERQKRVYRGGKELPDLRNQTVILVDDGVATGFTMFTAIKAARAAGAKRIVVAVPVGPPATIEELRDVADDVVYLISREPFFAVGFFYRDFHQVTDGEVKAYLEQMPKAA